MTSDRNETGARGDLEQLMSIETLSDIIGVPVNTIKDWRLKGEGPVAYKIGNHLRYAGSDVHQWLSGCREDTADGVAFHGRR